MSKLDLQRLNISAFIDNRQSYRQVLPINLFPRLQQELVSNNTANFNDCMVNFTVTGQLVSNTYKSTAAPQRWLQLAANSKLFIPCQRCLDAYEIKLNIDCALRFVNSEAELAHEEQYSEDELILISNPFNLLELIEDELLLSIPLICKHEICDNILTDTKAEANPSPFAVLASFKNHH